MNGWKMITKFNKLLILIFIYLIIFLSLYFTYDVFSKMVSLNFHSMEFKLLLVTTLSTISILFVSAAYMAARIISLNNDSSQITPQTRIVELLDLLEDEISIINTINLNFLYMNKSLLKNSMYSKRDLAGKGLMTLYPQYTVEEIREYFQPLVAREKDSLSFEITRTRKDGTTYQALVRLKYYSDTNTLISISRDITKEKELENIKKQNVSENDHYIRTSLTKISGSLKIISSGMVGEVPLALKEMLNVANSNTIELLDKINELTNNNHSVT